MTGKEVLRAQSGRARASAAPSPAEPDGKSGQIGAARRARISEAAYYRAQKRGFEPGREIEDWLSAEAEITGMSLLRDLQPETH